MISPRWLILASAAMPMGVVLGLSVQPELDISTHRAAPMWTQEDDRDVEERGHDEAVMQMSVEVRERRTHLERDEYVHHVYIQWVYVVEGPQCLLDPGEEFEQAFEKTIKRASIWIEHAVESGSTRASF